MKLFIPKLTASVLIMVCAIATAQDRIYSDEFPIGDITLLDGPLKRAMDVNAGVLLQYDCDRLLAPYRKQAGLEPRKPSYPNWDGLDGHVGGHYLTAMAMYAAQGNQECRERMDYMLSELKECWQANKVNNPEWGKDYIGGMPDSKNIWSNFKKGNLRVYSSAWAPFYNLHKMFAGLRDAWVYCGDPTAKELFLHFCDWAVDITSGLSDEQMEAALNTEHGGMDEVLADAYAISGDVKYLDCARRFAHKAMLDPLANHQDILDNLHANTQVPKVVGFERIFELGGESKYHEASVFFWDVVTGERSLSFGGNSRREHFPTRETSIDFVNDIDGPESCNTNNMLKLTEELHRTDPDSRYADFYERAIFNHILSTQHPEHGGYVYFTSARPRHYRNYSVPNEAMWCCVGTGMENHGKYGQFIYTRRDADLYVNLYAASELNWKENGVVLRQETAFPYSESSRITIVSGGGKFAVMLRRPAWTDGFAVKVNGRQVNADKLEKGYLRVARKWKKGDVIEVSFPMHGYVEHMPNVPQYVAIMYGPVLLGMKTGTEDLQALLADDSRFGQYASGEKLPIDKAPYLIADDVDRIGEDLVPVKGKPLHFTLSTRMENRIEGELQPFFEIHDSRYMMYWLAFDNADHQTYLDNLAREEADRQALERRTADKVQPGEQQPETDHDMVTDQSEKGDTDGAFYRDARDGHYFGYTMVTGGRTDLAVRVKYWGQDEWRTCEYDLFVDGKLIKSVNNTRKWRTSQFKYEEYPIPAELLKGKSEIEVKFVAHKGRQVGQIYEVRLVGDASSSNPSQLLTDKDKIVMVRSLKSVDGGRLMEMDYTQDYHLDKLLDSNVGSFEGLLKFMGDNLLDVVPEGMKAMAPVSGCSAFAATDPVTSDKYFGRNYDFCHVENGEEVPITALLVRTAPKDGKKSITMCDTYWLGYKAGFYNDGKSDLSMLMGAPYTVLDGMNEDGFAVGILHLLGNPTDQKDPGKKSIWCNVLMRAMLDKAGSVDEAIELARSFNVSMVNPAGGNNHFFLADASGNYAILEYTFEEGANVEEATPNRMITLTGQEHSYVTNFYVDPALAQDSFLGGLSTKGKARYLILNGTLWLNVYKLTYEQSRDLLKSVSTSSNPEENTSHTQWSALYNLTQRTMDLSILQEFGNKYSFKIR